MMQNKISTFDKFCFLNSESGLPAILGLNFIVSSNTNPLLLNMIQEWSCFIQVYPILKLNFETTTNCLQMHFLPPDHQKWRSLQCICTTVMLALKNTETIDQFHLMFPRWRQACIFNSACNINIFCWSKLTLQQ